MKRLSKEEFSSKLKLVQPDLKVIGEYLGGNTHVEVVDTLGIHYLSRPCNLLKGKVPNLSTAINKKEAYNIKLKKIFPNLYAEDYICGKNKIIVNDELGIRYLVNPSTLLLGYYPTIQTAIDKNEAFKILAEKIHSYYYDYKKSIYTGMNNKLLINCKIHGDFFQKPGHHLQGQGCRKCADIKMSEKGWEKEKWIEASKRLKHSVPKLYVIKLYNKFESFIKIGITFTTIHKRFISKIPYDYKIIKTIEDSADVIFDKEKTIHEILKKHKYIPKIRFGGMYECYNESIVKQILIKEKII